MSPSGTCPSPMKEFPFGSLIKGKLLLDLPFRESYYFCIKEALSSTLS